MDPNAALSELRTAAREWEQAVVAEDADGQLAAAVRALEAAVALDDWMSRGGFPPAAWHRNCTHHS